MFGLFKRSAPPYKRRGHLSGIRLRPEVLEDRDIPAVIYSEMFDWGNGADVMVTVDDDAPGYEGLYLWTFSVTNDTFIEGLVSFAVPVEDSTMVSNLGSNIGWTPSVGAYLGDPDIVSWQQGSGQPAIEYGDGTDFWFTTAPTGIGLTNAMVDAAAAIDNCAGFVAVPTAAPAQPQPLPYPAILVTTEEDKAEPGEGLTSLREAIDYRNTDAPPLLAEVRFSAGITGKAITLGLGGTLQLKKDIWINGTERNITVTQAGVTLADTLFVVTTGANAVFDSLKLTGGTEGAISAGGFGLTVRSCLIYSNQGSFGGGIAALSGTVEITDSYIFDNHVDNEGTGQGGGIYIGGRVTNVTIINTEISENTAADAGGGIYIVGGDTELNINTFVTLNNNWIVSNEAGNLGGGVAVGADSGASPILVLNGGTSIQENVATAGNSKGGGVYLGAGTVVLNNVWIGSNTANQGSGMYRVQGTTKTLGPLGVTWYMNNEVVG